MITDREADVFMARWILWIILCLVGYNILLVFNIIPITGWDIGIIILLIFLPLVIFLRSVFYDNLKIWGRNILGGERDVK